MTMIVSGVSYTLLSISHHASTTVTGCMFDPCCHDTTTAVCPTLHNALTLNTVTHVTLTTPLNTVDSSLWYIVDSSLWYKLRSWRIIYLSSCSVYGPFCAPSCQAFPNVEDTTCPLVPNGAGATDPRYHVIIVVMPVVSLFSASLCCCWCDVTVKL